jgi:murein L,D-transpeptidase YcbB/YkuD
MKSLREYIDVIKEADTPVAGNAAERRRAAAQARAGQVDPAAAPAAAAPAAPAPVAQPAANPQTQALQKEIQGIQQQIATAKATGDQRAVSDYTVQLNGAQTDLAKVTGAPAPAPVQGASAAYGNVQAGLRGQQQNINRGTEELKVAQANGDTAAAAAAQAKIDQATANKADVTWADKDHPYGTKSGKNLTPSTGPAQAAKPKPTAPAIPPDQLKKYQSVLNAEGYPTTVDGVWGPGTQKAVTDFQRANGLGADGQIGPQTKAALDSFAATPVAASAGQITTSTLSQADYEKKMAQVNAGRQAQGQAALPITKEDKILLNKMLTIAGLR